MNRDEWLRMNNGSWEPAILRRASHPLCDHAAGLCEFEPDAIRVKRRHDLKPLAARCLRPETNTDTNKGLR